MKKYTKGELNNIPDELVEIMLDRQEEQGNKRDASVFEEYLDKSKSIGGFYWTRTVEGYDAWFNALQDKNFDAILKHPANVKNKYPMLMWVGNTEAEVKNKERKRVVFMEKCGKYIAWSTAESFEEAENSTMAYSWKYAEPVIEEQTVEFPTSSIPEFGTDEWIDACEKLFSGMRKTKSN